MQDSNVQSKTKGQTRTNADTQVQSEVFKGAMFVTTAASATIGLWAVACFVGGLVASGGPISMLKGFITAVTGI